MKSKGINDGQFYDERGYSKYDGLTVTIKGMGDYNNGLTRAQGKLLLEAATAARCKPSELVCALAMAWFDMAQPDAPELNVMAINDALHRFVKQGRAPEFNVRSQLTTNSLTPQPAHVPEY